jgi:hypothetical protein
MNLARMMVAAHASGALPAMDGLSLAAPAGARAPARGKAPGLGVIAASDRNSLLSRPTTPRTGLCWMTWNAS